jgi:3-hydroxybutyryl-CoA dehydrogenase
METWRMRVSVVGAGLMGAGIGLGFRQHGAEVMYLVNGPRGISRADQAVRELAAELVEIGVAERGFADDVRLCASIDELPDSDLVIESVPEQQGLKRALLADLSAAQPTALLCSNTSSLSITALATDIVRPQRFAGMHFWYPAPLMPLVELVPGEHTINETLERAGQILSNHGKTPITLARDIPGFVWNRLVVAVLREAKFLVEQGVVGARELDLVVEHGLARRWSLTGPFASAVLGGVATFETVGANLLPQLDDATELDGLTALLDGYVPDPKALAAWRVRRLAERQDPGP